MIKLLPYVNFLIKLTEKDKRILIALLIVFIVIFVVVAYIGNGIKALMRRYGKGIDSYMHKLCSAELVTNPKEFVAEVYKKESKTLYFSTKWILRVFMVVFIGFYIYSISTRGDGESLFGFAFQHIKELKIVFETPRGTFFGFKNFPVDWPKIARGPVFTWSLQAIISYIMFIVTLVTVFGVTTSTLRFISRMHRARKKGHDVFTKSLDDANFVK